MNENNDFGIVRKPPEKKEYLKKFFSIVGAVIAFLVIVFLLYYLWSENRSLASNLEETQGALAQKTDELDYANGQINDLEDDKEDLEDDLDFQKDQVDDLKERVEEVTGSLSDVSNDIDTIKKREALDEELLKKYSKVSFLNENYIPGDLDQIDEDYLLGTNEAYFQGDALDFLEDLLDEAEDDNVELKVASAYRSFDQQRRIKDRYSVTYGEGTANQFSAEQGYSEHQLGTTADFTSSAVSGALVQSFDQTEAFAWLQENAHRYGFILSYPQGNQYYEYEPWHWRFVGKELADELQEENQHFYNTGQNEIDEYLVNIFDD